MTAKTSVNKADAAQNSMGTAKMSRLILTTGLPLMLSLLISSLYNFVDSVFVSYVSEDALTALSLAAPVQMIVSSLGLAWLVSVPGAVLSSALQGLSRGTLSLVLNTTRQTMLPLLFALLFSLFGQLNWIWIALILVEILCLPLALYIWKRARNSLDQNA